MNILFETLIVRRMYQDGWIQKSMKNSCFEESSVLLGVPTPLYCSARPTHADVTNPATVSWTFLKPHRPVYHSRAELQLRSICSVNAVANLTSLTAPFHLTQIASEIGHPHRRRCFAEPAPLDPSWARFLKKKNREMKMREEVSCEK